MIRDIPDIPDMRSHLGLEVPGHHQWMSTKMTTSRPPVTSESANSSEGNQYVTLKGGLALPLESIRLALELEERGFHLSREGIDTLVVRPHEQLTAHDCTRIRRWKWHLLALVDYE